MVRGADNRAKVVANAFRLLKPGGRFVLHIHNRLFRGLGWRRVVGQALRIFFGRLGGGDITMPQAYGGAPLALHHFSLWEAACNLLEAGLRMRDVAPLGIDGAPPAGWPKTLHTYGWLILAERPA
jgi:hypothetical protein